MTPKSWHRRFVASARAAGYAVLAFATCAMLLFRGDFRVFSGFEEFASSSAARTLHLWYADPGVTARDDTVSRILTSRMSTRITSGGNPWAGDEQEWQESCVGPTVIELRSGRIMVTGGATIEHIAEGGTYVLRVTVE